MAKTDNLDRSLLTLLLALFACIVICIVTIVSIKSKQGVTEVQGEVISTFSH